MLGADRETGLREGVPCGHDFADSPPAPSSREQASARTDALSLFRIYGEDELGADGYPFAWHRLDYDDLGIGVLTTRAPGIKHLVREQAGHRCERCHHPYRNGEHGSGEWTPCDEQCSHSLLHIEADEGTEAGVQSALWRILTVHHLNGVKADCRWWNLSALCQRCHLTIQGRVVMERAFIFEHSDWMKPHAAGFYADKYLGEQLTREQTLARLDELLGLERLA